jgi:uncharacterized protein YbjT (DUF2867 family)
MHKDLPVLVIGATGFLGRHIVAALVRDGYAVRCLARTPERSPDLAGDGVEVVKGDFLDAASVERAADGVGAVIVCVHTLTPQGASAPDGDYMDVETAGLRNVVAACETHGVKRVLYVTSIGVEQHAGSSWLRGRWQTEQLLFASGLDATAVRPGMIVGRGGDGFGIVARGATRRVAVAIGSPRQVFRTVAVDDLARDIVDLLASPAAIGKAIEVGSDDVLTMREMMSIVAATVGRRRATTIFVPGGVIRFVAPVVERLAKIPRGGLRGLVGDGPRQDMIGDPTVEREILGRTDRSFRESIDGQLG